MDRSWFRQPHPYEPGVLEDWLISYEDLEPHYQQVEDFLDVEQLPFAEPGFALAKTAAMKDASGRRVQGGRRQGWAVQPGRGGVADEQAAAIRFTVPPGCGGS